MQSSLMILECLPCSYGDISDNVSALTHLPCMLRRRMLPWSRIAQHVVTTKSSLHMCRNIEDVMNRFILYMSKCAKGYMYQSNPPIVHSLFFKFIFDNSSTIVLAALTIHLSSFIIYNQAANANTAANKAPAPLSSRLKMSAAAPWDGDEAPAVPV
jgi:hypothetical protein